MSNTSVLLGSPICQDPAILEEYLISLSNISNDGINMDFFFIDDNNNGKSKSLLNNFIIDGTIIDILDMKNTKEYIRTEVTHKWDESLVIKVIEYRNKLLSIAREHEYDYLFMVDSDLLLHPDLLDHLIKQDKDIISEIFWTKWTPGGKEQPQVWLYDNFTQYEIERGVFLSDTQIKLRTADFFNKLRTPGVYKVGGLGACTLISRKALKSGITYNRLPNVSFWGEDRHFCIRAAALGFDLYVDTCYPAFHIYRKKELKEAQYFKKKSGYKILELNPASNHKIY